MWYRMVVTQGFVPRKRFIWDKTATYKEIREMLFLTSSNFELLENVRENKPSHGQTVGFEQLVRIKTFLH